MCAEPNRGKWTSINHLNFNRFIVSRLKEAQPCRLIARRSQNELLYVEVGLMEGAIFVISQFCSAPSERQNNKASFKAIIYENLILFRDKNANERNVQ